MDGMFKNTKDLLTKYETICLNREMSDSTKDFLDFFTFKLAQSLICDYGYENCLKVAKSIELLDGEWIRNKY